MYVCMCESECVCSLYMRVSCSRLLTHSLCMMYNVSLEPHETAAAAGAVLVVASFSLSTGWVLLI